MWKNGHSELAIEGLTQYQYSSSDSVYPGQHRLYRQSLTGSCVSIDATFWNLFRIWARSGQTSEQNVSCWKWTCLLVTVHTASTQVRNRSSLIWAAQASNTWAAGSEFLGNSPRRYTRWPPKLEHRSSAWAHKQAKRELLGGKFSSIRPDYLDGLLMNILLRIVTLRFIDYTS